jgi:MYXO-CTERM domain-containing protein
MKNVLVAGALALAVFVAPQAASAAPFIGRVDYVGTHTANDADLTVATGSTIDSALVLLSSGSFLAEGIVPFSTLDHENLMWDPSGAPYNPLWLHIGSGISFSLNTLNVDFRSANQINLSGTGVFRAGGFDDTDGDWNMTLNNTNGQATGTFSSSSSVPEPGLLALFGLGLFGAARRFTRRD